MLIENQMFLKGFIIIRFKHFWRNLNIELILAPGCEFLSAKCIQQSVKNVQIRIFFWSAFSRIRTEYVDLWSKYPYSVQMWENTDQKNSVFGHFSRSTISFNSRTMKLNEGHFSLRAIIHFLDKPYQEKSLKSHLNVYYFDFISLYLFALTFSMEWKDASYKSR